CPRLPELGQPGSGVHTLPTGAGGAPVRVTLSDPAGFGTVLLEPAPPPSTFGAGPSSPAARTRPEAASPERPQPSPDPRGVEAALPPTLSYTSMSQLEACGYRYYLERVLRMPEERATDAGARGGGGAPGAAGARHAGAPAAREARLRRRCRAD